MTGMRIKVIKYWFTRYWYTNFTCLSFAELEKLGGVGGIVCVCVKEDKLRDVD